MMKILFRYDAYKNLGMGHAYRCNQIIRQMNEYECVVALGPKTNLAFDLLRKNHVRHFKFRDEEELLNYIKEKKIDIVVNDILGTSIEYILNLKKLGCRVVNLEDEGDGAAHADVVINELYEKDISPNNYFYGKQYYCLPSELVNKNKNILRKNVKKIILLFGGTDPAHLTEKTILALNEMNGLSGIDISVIIGPGNMRNDSICDCVKSNRYKDSIQLIRGGDLTNLLTDIDFAICSQGRTMYELAHLMIPTIIMAQNKREMLHTFASKQNGFINLGLGQDVSEVKLQDTISLLFQSFDVRKELYDNMSSLHLEYGLNRVKNLIIGTNCQAKCNTFEK